MSSKPRPGPMDLSGGTTVIPGASVDPGVPDSPFNKPPGSPSQQTDTRPGLTTMAERLGFSAVRANKATKHTLDVDPRTKLKIISLPPDLRKAFSDLQNCIIHVCSECFRVTNDHQLTERIVIVTDQTLFLCSSDGRVSRCIQVDKIHCLYMSRDNKALALEVPLEYDLVLMFRNMNDRDRVIRALRTIYTRMMHGLKLGVELVKKGRTLDPVDFRTVKPPGFKVRITPQRSKDQLLQSLQVFESEEEAMLHELDMIQGEMESTHLQVMTEKQQQLEGLLHKLRETVRECWENEKQITKLEEDLKRGRTLIAAVDGAFGPENRLPANKDARIFELERIVARLNASVFGAQTEQQRQQMVQATPGTFFDKDLLRDILDPKWPVAASNGQLANISEVLQQQLLEKKKELEAYKDLDDKIKQAQDAMNNIEERKRRIAFELSTQKDRGGEERKSVSSQMNSSVNHQVNSSGSQRPGGAASVFGGGFEQLGDRKDGDPLQAISNSELTPSLLEVDPRTDLRIVQVPDSFKTPFSELIDTIIHFFGTVKSTSKSMQVEKRICIISEQSVYIASLDGTILRCMDIAAIDAIVLDAAFTIGLKDSTSYDLMFTCATPEHRQEIVEIMQRIYSYYNNSRSIPVLHIQRFQRMEAELQLLKPSHYERKITFPKTKAMLVDAIKEKRNRAIGLSADKDIAMPVDIEMPPERIDELRREVLLQLEHEWRQDPAIIQLRQQLDTLDDQIHMAVEESHLLRCRIEDHRCEDNVPLTSLNPSSGMMPSAGPGIFRPGATSNFFVPTEPIKIDVASLGLADVQKLFLWDSLLVTSHCNGEVSLWDIEQKGIPLRVLGRQHQGRVTTMQYDGVRLVTGSHDSTIRLWDVRSGLCKSVLYGHRGYVHCIHFHSDKMISGGADSLLQVWDLQKECIVQTLKGHKTAIVAHKFVENTMVSIDWGWMHMWDLREGKPVRTLQDQYGGLRCLDFDGTKCVTGGTGGDLTVWNMSKGGGETMQGHDDDVHCVQLHGRYAVTSGGDCKIRTWDVDQLKSLSIFNESYPHDTKSFHMRGNRFAASQGQYVMLWSK